MKDDYRRLLQAASELRNWITPSEIAAQLTKHGYAVSDQSMTNWKSRGLSKEGILRASSILGCRPLWLETGQGAMTDERAMSQHSNTFVADDSSAADTSGNQAQHLATSSSQRQGSGVFKPIIEWDKPEDLPEGQYVFVRRMRVRLSAGNGHLIFDEEEGEPLAFTTRWIKSRGLSSAHLVVVTAAGDSMEPTIRDGNLILIDRAQTTMQEGHVFAIRYGDELRVKRLYARYDGGLILRSDNRSKYPDQEIPAPDLRHIDIVGRVVWSAGEM